MYGIRQVKAPKTRYALLMAIRRYILANPRRYNQRTYIRSWDDPTTRNVGACGCVMGIGRMRYGIVPTYNLPSAVDGHDRFKLVRAAACGKTTPGTVAHARKGAANIMRFAKKYEALLKRLPARW